MLIITLNLMVGLSGEANGNHMPPDNDPAKSSVFDGAGGAGCVVDWCCQDMDRCLVLVGWVSRASPSS
jgi:hypothetical protein